MENDKYLFLKFRNAGFFRDQHATKDFVFDKNGKKKRAEFKQYVSPITVHQISNALHVLMGERPVPSLRDSNMNVIPEIFDLAQNGYLNITTFMKISKENVVSYPEESITIRKAVWNSFSTAPSLVYWERIRRLLENELYQVFISLLDEIFCEDNVVGKYDCTDAFDILRKKYSNDIRLTTFLDVMLKKGKTPLVNFYNQFKDPAFNSNERTKITTNFGVDKITRLDGEIIIPMNDVHLAKINANKGFANLLDGGLLWINKIVDEDIISISTLDNFTKISEISTETKNSNQYKNS
jgi:hypothetical protein